MEEVGIFFLKKMSETHHLSLRSWVSPPWFSLSNICDPLENQNNSWERKIEFDKCRVWYMQETWYIYWNIQVIILGYLAHLGWKRNWAFLIARCPASVCLSVLPSVNFYIFDFFSRTTGPILTRVSTNHPWVKGIQVCSKEGDSLTPRGE
jgi:hypothetical protein